MRFLAFLSARLTMNSLGISQCLGAIHSGDFPKCAYQAVDVIKVVEDVEGDAQAFASR